MKTLWNAIVVVFVLALIGWLAIRYTNGADASPLSSALNTAAVSANNLRDNAQYSLTHNATIKSWLEKLRGLGHRSSEEQRAVDNLKAVNPDSVTQTFAPNGLPVGDSSDTDQEQ